MTFVTTTTPRVFALPFAATTIGTATCTAAARPVTGAAGRLSGGRGRTYAAARRFLLLAGRCGRFRCLGRGTAAEQIGPLPFDDSAFLGSGRRLGGRRCTSARRRRGRGRRNALYRRLFRYHFGRGH